MDVHTLKLWINFLVKKEVEYYVREHIGHRKQIYSPVSMKVNNGGLSVK